MPPSHEQSVLPGLSYHPGLRGWLAVRAVRDHSCAGRLLVPHLARFPAVVSALTDPRRRDGGEPGDDVLDGHAWGEHGDRPRRGRGAFGGPLGDPAQCFAGRADALGPPRPGRARAASFPATVSAVRNPGRMPGRAHAFRAHADCFQRRHISQPGLVLPQCLVGLRPARAFPRGTASPGITILTRKLDTQVSECPAT